MVVMRPCFLTQMMRALFLSMLLLLSTLSLSAVECDSVAAAAMECLSRAMAADRVSGVEAVLYLRQRVEVDKKNLLVNFFPDMTRFDRGENSYLSEYVYRVSSVYGRLPQVRLLSSLSTFGHGDGSMDRVCSFMIPHCYGERLFEGEYLSPLYATNFGYYSYAVDDAHPVEGELLVRFASRYDNIQLFEGGEVVLDERDWLPLSVSLYGWDEQSCFAVTFHMGKEGDRRCAVDSVDLSINYGFLGNRMEITAQGVFAYSDVVKRADVSFYRDGYDITAVTDSLSCVLGDSGFVLDSLRMSPLSLADSLFYASRSDTVVVGVEGVSPSDVSDKAWVKKVLWRVGDEAFSSHTLAWGESDLRISPLVNPSCLSYSSSRGVAYRFSMTFRMPLSRWLPLELKPMLGYSFKHEEFYWGVRGSLPFAPMRRGQVSVDVGRGSSVYSSDFLGLIKNVSLDSLHFDKLPLLYYRDFHVKANARMEVLNGFEVMLGANFYRRSLYGDIVQETVDGVMPKKCYRQFAPDLCLVWQPGMYYYFSNGRKVNVGSLAPRFALDVEQGVGGIFGSHGVYTRAEFDVQHKQRLSPGASLYLRAGVGGYFRTRDVYFVDYAFLKDNLMSLDKEDEVSGVFQLLDREWYNAAKNYLRLNASYDSPLLFLQRVVPRARFIKNETLYAGILFISHLCPYWECGYGVETPYVNVGAFVGFEKATFHKIGFKMTFSLFN